MSTSFLLLVAMTVSSPAAGTQDTPADRLVGQALQAELQGDNAQRRELLQQALQSSPACEAARWQTGHVREGRRWLTLPEAEKAAAENPLLQRYLKTRADCCEHMTPAMAHLTMARWCRQQAGLTEQTRFHWLKVLERNPDEPEALAALGMCRYQGELISRDEAQTRDKTWQAAQQWTRKLRVLAEKLDRKDATVPTEAAWVELRSISDLAAIPGLETIVAPRSEQLGLEVVAVLGRMRSQWAAASLVRLTQSPCLAVRSSAIEQLKRRPLEQTVPWVLAGMRWPAKLDQGVLVSAQGDIVHDCVVSVEDAEARVVTVLSAAMVYSDQPLTFVLNLSTQPRPNFCYLTWSAPSPAARYAHRQTAYQTYANRAQQTEQQVAAYNRQVEQQNAVAGQLLFELTGQDRGADPNAWLDWWTDYNEVTRRGEKPTYHIDNNQQRLIHDGPVTHITYMSCFPRGTLIRTQAGLDPIERIQAGDLVLAQHPETGELAYKAVIQTTLRRPSPLIRIRVEDEEFTATRGHPFWVAGEGWRMAKQLTTADRLHGLAGSWPINQVEELAEDEAYNLVVENFHTYFVGHLGLLVHDNAPRRPTTAVLPGLHAP